MCSERVVYGIKYLAAKLSQMPSYKNISPVNLILWVCSAMNELSRRSLSGASPFYVHYLKFPQAVATFMDAQKTELTINQHVAQAHAVKLEVHKLATRAVSPRGSTLSLQL